MKGILSFLCSTIGRKQLVGLTGLGLVGFVISHVSGNFLLFVGPEAYNMYSYKLTSNPLIYAAEVGLLLIFVVHLFLALGLSLQNYLARDTRYAMAASGPKGTSFAAKTMWFQGVLILVFVILHLITFKFGPSQPQGYVATYNGVEVRDLYRLMIEVFQSPVYVAWYLFALVILGLHLSHGFVSAVLTFGVTNPKYRKMFYKIGHVIALYVSLGFISQPIYIFFFHKG